MPGRNKPRWCAVDCPDCGNGTTMELVRRHDLASRLRCRCGTKRPARMQWLRGLPRRRRPSASSARVTAAREILARLGDGELNDSVADLWPRKDAT
jgi:hypothetical protein